MFDHEPVSAINPIATCEEKLASIRQTPRREALGVVAIGIELVGPPRKTRPVLASNKLAPPASKISAHNCVMNHIFHDRCPITAFFADFRGISSFKVGTNDGPATG
ncbi:hypothetical protein AB0H34_00900 [Saccharopolyspora shandongensis]|uniref:hypothetical protein n=1 Tax=Saccharopolyspora shandongensis TaxID=418495 RepID=UPI0034066C11